MKTMFLQTSIIQTIVWLSIKTVEPCKSIISKKCCAKNLKDGKTSKIISKAFVIVLDSNSSGYFRTLQTEILKYNTTVFLVGETIVFTDFCEINNLTEPPVQVESRNPSLKL